MTHHLTPNRERLHSLLTTPNLAQKTDGLGLWWDPTQPTCVLGYIYRLMHPEQLGSDVRLNTPGFRAAAEWLSITHDQICALVNDNDNKVPLSTLSSRLLSLPIHTLTSDLEHH